MRTAYFRIMWLALTAACLLTTACASAQESSAGQQSSVGRGARDPIQVDVIVGSEGKGMFTSAGVPPDNMPIYAAKDGAPPPGVEPLPVDIFMTKHFYKDRDLWARPPLLSLQLSRRPGADLGAVQRPVVAPSMKK
jgi:hypothetical protein